MIDSIRLGIEYKMVARRLELTEQIFSFQNVHGRQVVPVFVGRVQEEQDDVETAEKWRRERDVDGERLRGVVVSFGITRCQNRAFGLETTNDTCLKRNEN